jgi:transcriptional regulator with XRE-family HTH domain
MPDWVPERRQVIGGRIRDAREHANLTQAALGERIGRDHKTIHHFEYGTRVPNLNDLLLLARALDVPLTELVAE